MIVKALQRIRPGAWWTLNGQETYNNINWLDENQTKPLEQEINNEIQKIIKEQELTEYQHQRAAEYPSIQQQLDMQYWDSVNGTTTWQDAINAVKAKYPKPEGV